MCESGDSDVLGSDTNIGGSTTEGEDIPPPLPATPILSSHNLLNVRGGNEDAPVSKRVASERQVVSLTHTWSGLSLIALDSMGSLHFITLIRPADIGRYLKRINIQFSSEVFCKHF
ncbi:hypothetical protein E2C01_014503 [Portunus trituberculatus]|uniref:Uncharacterized protein n=1 Tax=Portunus trituberculatus TaxID=210409 RepID=A0A5B7DK39_PORTR|nr:hypothetical protein [Portunus trituberculatus]